MGVAPKAYTESEQVAAAIDHRALDLRGVVSLSTTASAPEALAVTSSQPPLPNFSQEPSHLDLYLPDHIAGVTKMVAPAPVATVAAASVRQLTEAEAIAVLREAGWPTELIPQALAVFCGIGNKSGHPRGESGCSPGAVGDSGRSLGLAQLNGETWAPYCGITQEMLMDALENARCALKVYGYDISRGQAPWQQWTVKP